MRSLLAGSLHVLAILGFTAGCTAGDFGPDGENPGLDGGPGVGEVLDGCVDAGADSGCTPRAPPGFECDSLVEVTCGATCGESPGCAAAQLLRDHEPERCAEALADTQTFPPCELGSCDTLVLKACGGDPPVDACVDAPGCAPAVELQSRARDPEATADEIEAAESDCLQALEDEVVFAPCP